MTTILITGVAGLLGSNLSRFLLDKGYRVVGIDNLSGGYESFLPKHENFVFYKEELENLEAINKIFDNESIDVVYHFAAYAAEGLSPFIRQFNYRNNVIASMSVINNCIKHDCKLIFTSSMAVYGKSVPPFTETMKQAPIDPYGIAKYTVEQDIIQAGEQFGLRYNIVRPHNVLGKYQNIWDRYRNVIGIFIRRALKGEPILVYGDGEQRRAFSDIKFYMQPFAMLMNDGYNGELYNIGADKEYTINQVADIVARIHFDRTGKLVTILHEEPRHEVKDAWCDHTKAKRDLAFRDETVLDDLIESMYVWATSEPMREVKNMEYEVDKNIYSFWK